MAPVPPAARRRPAWAIALVAALVVAVVGGIAVLAPGKGRQEKSREAVDVANIRSAYAEVTAAYLTDNEAHSIEVPVTSNLSDWQSDSSMMIESITASSVLSGTGASTPVTVAVDASGKVTIAGQVVTNIMSTT